ncbi:prephenate dehydrogenase [Candidatus Sumerlaeota bacterium]|nr:prephenate dehydrogenase [Candidatus Sumerlaeota bacterium]
MKRMFDTVAVVGLGLLGGSAAMAVKKEALASRVIAVGRRSMADAVTAGIVDEETTDIAGAASRADLVLLCAPVETIRMQLREVMQCVRPDAIITDAGSVKEKLVLDAADIPSAGHFVGSHPMVGSHLTGWQNGRADFFKGGIVYVTPSAATHLPAAARVGTFWRRLGAKVVYTDAKRHDYLCALLSHVPHFAAVALMEHLRKSREDIALIRYLSGTGLRDTTRVAAGSPVMWEEIAVQNHDNIADLLEQYAHIAADLAGSLRKKDYEAVSRVLAHAASLRSSL